MSFSENRTSKHTEQLYQTILSQRLDVLLLHQNYKQKLQNSKQRTCLLRNITTNNSIKNVKQVNKNTTRSAVRRNVNNMFIFIEISRRQSHSPSTASIILFT